jgi:5-(carboxyamino)imidazole ribonucleotide synthase
MPAAEPFRTHPKRATETLETGRTKAMMPDFTIGMLGGGQLGRMLAVAAARLGMKTTIYEPAIECPAAQTASRHICAAYDDIAGLVDFAASCDVITYEFENIPLECVEFLSHRKPVHPGISALETSQDRLTEKTFLSNLGIATAPFAAIESASETAKRLKAFGGKGILKSRRFGYDGKGQSLVSSAAEATAAWEELNPQPVILEGYVDFELEISVIGVRGLDGGFVAYDPAWNRHSQGILRLSSVPAPIDGQTAERAKVIARRIMDALDYAGVMGIELFVTKTGQLVVNEIAPRVHNSGHWTETACTISQFENHIRAICGLPLGSTDRHTDCEMENLIGDDVDRVSLILAEPDASVHLYGKHEVRTGRKMGHVNRLKPG